MNPKLILAMTLFTAPLLNGCAGAGLALMTTGAGIGGSVAVEHTMNGIAYKTVVASEADVHRATLHSLKQMDFPVVSDKATDTGYTIIAKAQERDITITLEHISSRTTRMRVTADQDIPLLKDQATATEIIVQTVDSLDHPPVVAQATAQPQKTTSRR